MSLGLRFYLGLARERLGLVGKKLKPAQERILYEKQLFNDFKSDWDWYNIFSSLFGEDYFPSTKPMNLENKESFISSLPEIIISNFEVLYDSLGMLLIPKKNLEFAVARA